jgi:hypothetical protein
MKDRAMIEGDKPKTDTLPAAAEATGTESGEQENSDSKVEDEGLKSEEVGGPNGLEPTRYGDWERKGRCIDF